MAANNIPNVLSAIRLPLAALFPLIGDTIGRAAVVLVAAASDWVDGRVARNTRQVTRTGELLDPIADKTFMLVALLTLAVEGSLPLSVLPLLLVRDIGVALGALVVAVRGLDVRMRARTAGKVVTWMQFAGIGAILLWPSLALWIAVPIAVAGAIALQDYIRAALR
ncbi:MAG TPA: CDP-alcohol phosphatidyltransferase family protein [Longimicrobiales bacterium]